MKKNMKFFFLITILLLSVNACAKKAPAPIEKEFPAQITPQAKKDDKPVRQTTPAEAPPPSLPSPAENVEIKDISPITPPEEKKGEGDSESEIIKLGEGIYSTKDKQHIIKFEDVYFDYDKYTIKKEMLDKLSAYAQWLKTNPKVKIEIEGHCDERGTIEYNLSLGEKRANSIKKYLVSFGVPPERIFTISYGEEKPADPGHDEEAWRKNRRGHFTLR